MIVSMTGFAAATRETPELSVDVTLRSVNHRHLDVQFRVPQSVQTFETALRTAIQQQVARGRVDVTIAVQERIEPVRTIAIDHELVRAVSEALTPVRESGLVTGALQPGDVLRLPEGVRLLAGDAVLRREVLRGDRHGHLDVRVGEQRELVHARAARRFTRRFLEILRRHAGTGTALA